MFRPFGISRPPRSVQRALFTLTLLVMGLVANLSLIPSVGATVQDLYTAPYNLWPGLTTTPLVHSDPATNVSSFTRDAIETSTLGGCGNYPSDTNINTYSVWYTFTPPAGGGWLTLSTFQPGTNYDTVLDVWHDAVASANRVACNDDAVSGDRRSELSIPVVATSTYYIAIRRYGSSTMPLPPATSGSEALAFYARFTASPEIYVDQTNGSDANPGSITLPVRTIQKGIDLAPAGGTVQVAAGAYGEDVVLSKNLTLIGTGNPTTTSFTLQSGVLGGLSGGITAGAVSVQASARIADGILLAAAGGSVTLDGSHTESVTIDKNLTLRSTTGATLNPSGAPANPTISVTAGVVTITGLNISGATGLNNSGGTVTASANWWGAATGPNASTNPGGGGSAITGAATFRPWCTVQAPTCDPKDSPTISFAPATIAAQNYGASPIALTASSNSSGALTYAGTTGVCTYNGAQVTIIGEGTCTVTANQAADPNYIAGSASLSFTVNKALPAITFSPATIGTQTYGVSPIALTVSSNSSGALTFSGTSGVCSYNGTQVTITGVGTCIVTANQAADANHVAGSTSLSFTVDKATPTITFSAAIGTQTYGVSPIALTASSNSSGALTYVGTTGVCTYNGVQVTIIGVGTCIVTANQAADANYLDGSNSLSFMVNQATPAIIFSPASIGTKNLSSPPITLTASSNSSGALTYSGTAGVCTYNGAQVTIIGVGTCIVTANQAADANYLAGSKSLSFTVDKDAPIITFSPTSINTQTYGAGPIALTVSSNSSGAFTYSGTSGVCSYNGTQVTIIGAGNCIVHADQAADATHSAATAPLSFTVDKASATTTLANQSYTYNGAPKPATFTTTPDPLAVSVTYNGSSAPPTNAGTYAVHITSADPNYTITSGTDATLTITKASATTNLANQFYTYDGTPKPATFTTTPDPLAVSVTYNGSGTPPTDAGTYAVHITSADPNYTITSGTDATLTIGQASQTITFPPLPNKTYGDPTFAISAAATSRLSLNFSATGNCTVDRSNVTITGAGTCTITASQAGDANWGAAADVSQTFTINKATQSISFSALRTRAVSNPAFTVSATATSGLPVSFSATGSCSVSGTMVTLSGVGTCTITASQPGDANWGAAADVPQTFSIVTSFKTYLPLLLVPVYPDLVGSFRISQPAFDPFDRVRITVTITNTGDAPASDFWVDFYINPLNPPTATNQPWDQRCGSVRCKYGIAWYVADTIAPGKSITLYSTPSSYYAKNTDWPGYFETKKLDLYLYVDSWNPSVLNGAVVEKVETNNRAELHLGSAQAPLVASAPGPIPTQALPALPDRPARLSEGH